MKKKIKKKKNQNFFGMIFDIENGLWKLSLTELHFFYLKNTKISLEYVQF